MGEAMIRRRRWVLSIGLVVIAIGCGTVDPGQLTLAPPQRLPDPVHFGSRIHPLLTRDAGCAATDCHASSSLFPLHVTEPLPGDSEIQRPLDLPEPLRSDYFTVLSRIDFDDPLASSLFRWAQADEASHPGGDALSATDRQTLLEWLYGVDP